MLAESLEEEEAGVELEVEGPTVREEGGFLERRDSPDGGLQVDGLRRVIRFGQSFTRYDDISERRRLRFFLSHHLADRRTWSWVSAQPRRSAYWTWWVSRFLVAERYIAHSLRKSAYVNNDNFRRYAISFHSRSIRSK